MITSRANFSFSSSSGFRLQFEFQSQLQVRGRPALPSTAQHNFHGGVSFSGSLSLLLATNDEGSHPREDLNRLDQITIQDGPETARISRWREAGGKPNSIREPSHRLFNRSEMDERPRSFT